MRKKIPVVDICNVSHEKHLKIDFFIDRFQHYLQHHYDTLHHPHRHSFYHLVLFTKGRGFHTIDFEKFKVAPFQIYFMIPGQVHSWHFEKDIEGFVINFSDTFFRSFLLSANYLEKFNFMNGMANDGCFIIPEKIQKTVLNSFEDLLEIDQLVQQNADEDWLKVSLLKLFITILNAKNPSVRISAYPLKQQFCSDFRKLIEKHFHTLKLPKDYAALMHITANHLNVLCNEIVGHSAGKLIRDRLILEAKRLLTNANLSIAEIADELNFEDNSYFNRFFKKYEGITPNDFRKQFITA